MKQRTQFLLLTLLALILEFVPIIRIPLKWFETFFHEISHGLVAIFTGGKILSVQLHVNGSGLCMSQGGWPILISFAGYAGAVFWGWLVIGIARKNTNVAKGFSVSILILLFFTLLFWARDPLTILILLVLMGLLFFTLRKLHHKWLNPVLMFLGITIILNAIKSPWYLIDGRSLGDGARLSELTFIPELFWIIAWVVIGCIGLYTSWRGLYVQTK